MTRKYNTLDHDFNPRPPRGGRPQRASKPNKPKGISIHALREEGDRRCNGTPSKCSIFQSTPSARRATNPYHCSDMPLSISIHALREEGDLLF